MLEQKPVRARSAAGTTPPAIARAEAQAAAACSAALDALTCCDVYDAPRIASEVLIPSLRTLTSREWGQHIELTLAAFVSEHHDSHRRKRTGTRSGTWRRLSYDDVCQGVREAMDSTDEPASIEQAVEDAILAGYDGELLVSEIIIRETHKHTGLIHKEISKLRGSIPNCDPADLIGFGWRGLRVALRQFDPARGYSFSTFACPKINGAIRDGIRSEHHLPKRLTTFARKLSAAEEHLTQNLQRTPSFSDIAAYLEDDSAPLSLTSRLAAPASLEEMTAVFGEGEREPSCLVDSADPEMEALLSARRESVRLALGDLSGEAQELMTALFFDEVTLTAAAERMGIEVRAARAMRTEALASLRVDLAAWAPGS